MVMHQSILRGGRATTFFDKKFRVTFLNMRTGCPAHRIRAERKDSEKDWNRFFVQSIIQYGDYDPSSAVETKAFLRSYQSGKFLKFLLLNQNLNFWYE